MEVNMDTSILVLYVDDSLTMRRIIKNSLTKLGFNNLIEAENGADALEKIRGKKIGLVLTDWNMPEMTGEEFVRHLRSSQEYKDVPIVMITTRSMKEDVIVAAKLRVNGYIIKPFNLETLQKKLETILK